MSYTLQTTHKKKKRVGRGGARGKNAGHGNKGQRSRAGHKIRPAIRDEMQRIPKKRGHNKNRARTVRTDKVVRTVTLRTLGTCFQKDSLVTPKVLIDKQIVSPARGLPPKVKIVATGSIDIPLRIRRCAVSDGAKEMIQKAGGTIK